MCKLRDLVTLLLSQSHLLMDVSRIIVCRVRYQYLIEFQFYPLKHNISICVYNKYVYYTRRNNDLPVQYQYLGVISVFHWVKFGLYNQNQFGCVPAERGKS